AIRCAVSVVPRKMRPVGAGSSALMRTISSNSTRLFPRAVSSRFAASAAQAFAGRKGKRGKAPAGPWKKLDGFDIFTSVYEVDQAPIGKTSRSTPATYIGLMDEMRALFARLPLARQR